MLGKPRVVTLDVCLHANQPVASCAWQADAARHCAKHASDLQSTIALSSGESEYYAAVKAAALGLSRKALFADWGIEVSITVLSDSSAARGTAQACTDEVPLVASASSVWRHKT